MIEFKNVIKQYPNGFRAVDNVSLEVPPQPKAAKSAAQRRALIGRQATSYCARAKVDSPTCPGRAAARVLRAVAGPRPKSGRIQSS